VFSNGVGERLSNEQHRAEWLATCDAAGVHGLQFRDLRRTFASELHETPGVAPMYVTNALGHANARTTDAYLSGSVTKLDDALRRKEAQRTAIRNGVAISPADDATNGPTEPAANPANLLN
jgi:integrase